MTVVLEDVSLRDGLQGELRLFTLDEKLAIVGQLVEAGFRRLQVGSFVHPDRLPQMADTDILVTRVRAAYPLLCCTGLVLNERGLARALACGLGHVSLSVSLSDSHSRRNVGRPATEALEAICALVSRAVNAGLVVRAGLMCAFGCPDEGPIPAGVVLAAAEQLAAAGAAGVNLADTAGMAGPMQVRALVGRMRAALPDLDLSLHLHDTRGLGLVNLLAGYEAGVRLFDVAAGGLGGCPFLPGAAGNVAAEEAVHLFQTMGIDCGIDLALLCRVVRLYENLLARPLPGRIARVLSGFEQDSDGKLLPGDNAVP